MKLIFKTVALIFIIIFVFGCKHHPIYNGEPIIDNNCDPSTVYFQNTILPLLNSHCAMSGCHNSITQAEGINLTTYATAMNSGEGGFIVPYDANGSQLYHVIVDGSMPPNPFANLSASEIQNIYDWINQGALNNYCADCDTTKFLFNTDIWPIINSKCSGCHGAVNPNGATTLLNYGNVNSIVLNGKLEGVITGIGYPVMPPSVGLSDCEKTKILKWVNDGALNN
jgi:hypothetical protein